MPEKRITNQRYSCLRPINNRSITSSDKIWIEQLKSNNYDMQISLSMSIYILQMFWKKNPKEFSINIKQNI